VVQWVSFYFLELTTDLRGIELQIAINISLYVYKMKEMLDTIIYHLYYLSFIVI
jgi:hypothetical protein